MPWLPIVRVVDFCRRHAILVILAAAVLTPLLAVYTAEDFSIDTDSNRIISDKLDWRRREAVFDLAFPQRTGQLVVVIDGATPDVADDAAAALAARLAARPDLFRTVLRPDAGEFFERNGLLYLTTAEVQTLVERLIEAQPLIGSLAADPTLHGLFAALNLALEGIARGEGDAAPLDRPLDEIAAAVENVAAGKPGGLSWQRLMTDRTPKSYELRRFILTQPMRDFEQLQPGEAGTEFIRKAAADLKLTPDRGVRVRLTGSVALADEEFVTLREGMGIALVLSLSLVGLLLFIAVRSLRVIVPIVITLLTGLIATAAFAVVAVGSFNLISIAFAVMFVGVAVDFGIQFSVRYRDERHRQDDMANALKATASGIGGSLLLAALTTTAGFFSFLPTAYSGVSELGLIAGAGMVIALALNLTLLPALLVLFRPKGEPSPVGYVWAAPIDRFLLQRRRPVLAASALLCIVGLAALPFVRFDFNPLNLKDPRTESVSTILDLLADPDTSPFTIDILMPSPPAAAELAQRLEKLPEVHQALTIASFVPEDQDEKLALIGDAAMVLGPTLNPIRRAGPATEAATESEIKECVQRLKDVGAKDGGHPAFLRLAAALEQVLAAKSSQLPALSEALTGGLERRLDGLRKAISPEKVSLDHMPPDLWNDWVAADGRARIEVFPKGDAADNELLQAFTVAVRAVAPMATGAPVTMVESGRTVTSAFRAAGLWALGSIAVLLWIMLRRVGDVVRVLAPLVVSGLLTLAVGVALDLPINYANIISLPLLIGLGVSYSIYLVVNWRKGQEHPLQSSTARAVIYSALTTMVAFGSLGVSSHPGTADMGKLLTIALTLTLLSTLLFLPALLGPPPVKRP